MKDNEALNKAVGAFLKGELVKRNISHEDLSVKLAAKGFKYSRSSITTKLHRGTFSAAFYLQCLMVIGYDSADANEIKKLITE